MKKYLITGLLIWIPLVITIWVLKLGVDALDKVLLFVPKDWRPESTFGFHIYGLGVVITVAIVLLTGVFATNFFGAQLVKIWHDVLHQIPVVRAIYSSVKQISDTLFSSSGQAFRKALLVQWPIPGTWTIAFLTGTPGGEVARHLQGEHLSVYVPTTPNPTGGYFVVVARKDVIELDMSVDEALKYVISMGVAPPNGKQGKNGKHPA
jgi:uncharacterized membrane protein